MSTPATRPGGGPRRSLGPRAGSSRRVPAAARRPGHSTGRSHGAQDPATDDSAARAEPVAPPAGLSGLQQLLYELDMLLRDPTLTRALRSFAAKLSGGVRAVGAATVAAAKRLAAAVARLRLPYLLPVLAVLLALLVALALPALLASRDDEPAPSAAGEPAAGAGSAQGSSGLSAGAVGMPDLAGGSRKVAPVSVALVLDRTYDAVTRRRELRALGAWLGENHAPGTRVSVIDARTGRASRPLRASNLVRARPTQPRSSTTDAIDSAFRRQDGERLLVTLGSDATPRTARAASTLSIATRRGAGTRSSVPSSRRKRSAVTIDDRRPDALAGSVARKIMAISGQRERR